MRFAWAVTLLAGCFTSGEDDVVGPFTGEPRYYVVDGITLPRNQEEARFLGEDLGGKQGTDNQIGSVIASLAGNDAVNNFGADIIAAGVIRSRLEIVADKLEGDDTVGVSYFGFDGAIAEQLGGRMEDGTFTSNRTRSSSHLGTAVVKLPVFQDADPSTVEVLAAQLTLVPDGTGGFDGRLQGVALPDEVKEATFAGILQQLDHDPRGHRTMWQIVDADADGTITRGEFDNNSLILSLLAPDLTVELDGIATDVLSLGFAFHVASCASATDCPTATPINTCFDRALDGDETAIDCGGSCQACAGDAACSVDGDCQSNACTSGVCEAASCSDGVLSAFESDVDCGRTCTGCATGLQCERNEDCASNACNQFGRCF